MKSLLALLCFWLAPLALFATDISITAANVVPSSAAEIGRGTAGATITAGQLLYKDSSDGYKLKLADCNASAATTVVVGMALNGASSGQPVAYVIYDPALAIAGSRTIGDIYVLSATAGGVAPASDIASGHYVVVVGVVTSSTTIFFDCRLQAGAAKA